MRHHPKSTGWKVNSPPPAPHEPQGREGRLEGWDAFTSCVRPSQAGRGAPPLPAAAAFSRHPPSAKTLYKKFVAKKSPEERRAVPAAGRRSATRRRHEAMLAGPRHGFSTRAAVGGIPAWAGGLQWTTTTPRDMGYEHSSFSPWG